MARCASDRSCASKVRTLRRESGVIFRMRIRDARLSTSDRNRASQTFHMGWNGRQGHSNAVAEMLAGFMLVDRHRVAIDIAGIVSPLPWW